MARLLCGGTALFFRLDLDDPMTGRQREEMPRHDPIPRRRRPADGGLAAAEWRRYRAMMSWMALAAAVAVALSLLYLGWFEELRLHMVIATIAGVGLTVLVGTGLMGLVFMSSRSGHDEQANCGDIRNDG